MGLAQRLGVAHRHLRRQVPEVALHHVHRHTALIRHVARVWRKRCTCESGGRVRAVADVCQLGELLEALGERGLGVGVAAAVLRVTARNR